MGSGLDLQRLHLKFSATTRVKSLYRADVRGASLAFVLCLSELLLADRYDRDFHLIVFSLVHTRFIKSFGIYCQLMLSYPKSVRSISEYPMRYM